MRFWLYITTLDNWYISKKNKIIGVSEQHQKIVEKISKGDKGVIYIKCYGGTIKIKDPQIVASFTIGSAFFDPNPLFEIPKQMAKNNFPFRYIIQNVELYKYPIKMKTLVENLNLFKNKKRWGMHLMGRGIVELTEEDYNTIIGSVKI